MGDLGSGNGTAYPVALDTDVSKEFNSPDANKTKARAEVINDLNAAVIAVQTELGIDPAGSLTDVKTFLQTEHAADGTHNATLTGATLTTPTIADFTNATHNHADAAGGGNTLSSPAIANFTNATHNHFTAAAGGQVLKFNELRAKFTHVDDENITISAAQYYCKDKFCWWNDALTSTDIPAATSDWVYLYLDYSAITGGTEITNAELIWSTDEPSWTEAQRAWMRTVTNTDDRCIFAVRTDGSDDILEFFHDGGDLVIYADDIAATLADGTPSDTFSDVTYTAPSFCTKVQATLMGTRADTNGNLMYRTNGQSGSTGHQIGRVQLNVAQVTVNTLAVITDSSQIIEMRWSAASAGNTIESWIIGWYFPIGM
jgi:hypothetical protein